MTLAQTILAKSLTIAVAVASICAAYNFGKRAGLQIAIDIIQESIDADEANQKAGRP